MILGVGVDHVPCGRMEKILSKWRGRFQKRVFDESELHYALSRREPHLHLAARFAAKEAFFKALGTGYGRGVNWTDVTVKNRTDGKPDLLVKGKARDLADGKGVRRIHVSLSHTGDSAVAVVILED